MLVPVARRRIGLLSAPAMQDPREDTPGKDGHGWPGKHQARMDAPGASRGKGWSVHERGGVARSNFAGSEATRHER